MNNLTRIFAFQSFQMICKIFCLALGFFLSSDLYASDFIADDFFQNPISKAEQTNSKSQLKQKKKAINKKSGLLSKYLEFLQSEEIKYKTRYPVYPESKIAHFLFAWMPEYQELRYAKAEMERKNEFGFYRYSHRLAMCRIGQMGGTGSFLSPTIGFVFSFVKELDDVYQKSFIGNMDLSTAIAQSWVDMENSYEALKYGYDHPYHNCRQWLEHFDYKADHWEKQKVQTDLKFVTPNEKAIK